jgi:YD repeat-containing protein
MPGVHRRRPGRSTIWIFPPIPTSRTSFLRSAFNPENGTVSYTYNGDGTLLMKTDAKTQMFTYAYDGYKRMTQVSANGTLLRTLSYDSPLASRVRSLARRIAILNVLQVRPARVISNTNRSHLQPRVVRPGFIHAEIIRRQHFICGPELNIAHNRSVRRLIRHAAQPVHRVVGIRITRPRHPQTWNRYAYVANDPLNFNDPRWPRWLRGWSHSECH